MNMAPTARRDLLALALASLGLGAYRSPPNLQPRARIARKTGLRWAVDYGAATAPALARGYHLLVLEPDHARAPAPLRGPGAVLLGYLSMGEVERSRSFVSDLDAQEALAGPNPNWPDARYVDLRHPSWRTLVLDQLVPAILARGYDGMFLDTLDNAEALERADPAKNAGMVAAAASLLAEMRRRFPAAVIMMNRGYALLPAAAGSVDVLLGEAMASRWNFAATRYETVTESDWTWQATRLHAAKAANPALVLTTLDYWDPADRRGAAALYARERAAGFSPYVSVLALDRIVPEPLT